MLWLFFNTPGITLFVSKCSLYCQQQYKNKSLYLQHYYGLLISPSLVSLLTWLFKKEQKAWANKWTRCLKCWSTAFMSCSFANHPTMWWHCCHFEDKINKINEENWQCHLFTLVGKTSIQENVTRSTGAWFLQVQPTYNFCIWSSWQSKFKILELVLSCQVLKKKNVNV